MSIIQAPNGTTFNFDDATDADLAAVAAASGRFFPGGETLNAASSPLAVAATTRRVDLRDDGGAANALQLPAATGSGREIVMQWMDTTNGWGANLTPAAGEFIFINGGSGGAGVAYNWNPQNYFGATYIIRDIGLGLWWIYQLDSDAMNAVNALGGQVGQLVNLISSASGVIPAGDGDPGNDVGNLFSNPIELLGTFGAGQYIEVVSFRTYLDFQTTDYDGVSQNCALRYGAAGADVVTPVTSDNLGITAGGVVQPYNWVVPHSTGFGVDDAGLQFYMAVNNPSAGAGPGDSPLNWEITYRVRRSIPNT